MLRPPQFECVIARRFCASVRKKEFCVISSPVTLPVMPTALPSTIREAVHRSPKLSDRESEILRLLAYGFDNRTIARELRICESTVKKHMARIMITLGVNSRLQAGLIGMIVWLHEEHAHVEFQSSA
jgi:DNA-binding NarL/FixJ family response regulator